MRPIRQIGAPLTVALALGACVHAPDAALPGSSETPWRLPVSEAWSQRLFRLSYEGPEGGGGLRLVLRLAEAGDFQLAASDALGRLAWSLELAGRDALLVDHRRQSYCSGGADLDLPALALRDLPLAALPLVLLGRLPVPPAGSWPEQGRKRRFRDEAGRAWRARLDAAGLASWTLFESGRPLLWWLRTERGGILSHRRGAQLRWRQVVREPMARDSLVPLAPPAGYRPGGCDEPLLPELREDQSPPAGRGAA